jgi:hypothetical protein
MTSIHLQFFEESIEVKTIRNKQIRRSIGSFKKRATNL